MSVACEGCVAKWPFEGPGVPLRHYLTEHPGTEVGFHCLACMAYHQVPIEAVVKRLKARRIGDEGTGIIAVGTFSSRPCKRCGGTHWQSRPAFVAPRMGAGG